MAVCSSRCCSSASLLYQLRLISSGCARPPPLYRRPNGPIRSGTVHPDLILCGCGGPWSRRRPSTEAGQVHPAAAPVRHHLAAPSTDDRTTPRCGSVRSLRRASPSLRVRTRLPESRRAHPSPAQPPVEGRPRGLVCRILRAASGGRTSGRARGRRRDGGSLHWLLETGTAWRAKGQRAQLSDARRPRSYRGQEVRHGVNVQRPGSAGSRDGGERSCGAASLAASRPSSSRRAH